MLDSGVVISNCNIDELASSIRNRVVVSPCGHRCKAKLNFRGGIEIYVGKDVEGSKITKVFDRIGLMYEILNDSALILDPVGLASPDELVSLIVKLSDEVGFELRLDGFSVFDEDEDKEGVPNFVHDRTSII